MAKQLAVTVTAELMNNLHKFLYMDVIPSSYRIQNTSSEISFSGDHLNE